MSWQLEKMFKLVTLFLKNEPYEYQLDLNYEFINPVWNMILIPLLDIHHCHGVPRIIQESVTTHKWLTSGNIAICYDKMNLIHAYICIYQYIYIVLV